MAEEPMPQAENFLPAERIRELAGAAASKALPDELAETLPVPIRVNGVVELLIMFYRETGPPGQRTVNPPDYAMRLDPFTGKVIRLWSCEPEDLGIVDPNAFVEGVGVRPAMGWKEFTTMRKRFLAISPLVWQAWAGGSAGNDPATRELAREYRDLFRAITVGRVAPFYVQAAAPFFSWLNETTAGAAP
jgi:hypothetical protein